MDHADNAMNHQPSCTFGGSISPCLYVHVASYLCYQDNHETGVYSGDYNSYCMQVL